MMEHVRFLVIGTLYTEPGLWCAISDLYYACETLFRSTKRPLADSSTAVQRQSEINMETNQTANHTTIRCRRTQKLASGCKALTPC